MLGLGEPRSVGAGVVGGSYFDVMGLRPVMGRLLNTGDDGPNAAAAAVLTHRFWMTSLKGDPTVIGKTIRLGTRSATIVGVLEPSVPYPSETEVIANVVTSPHHMSATMVTGREHRMTEIFGRLAPGVDLESARAEIQTVHKGIVAAHPETYKASADYRVNVVRLRDQITSRARTVLLVLLAASGLIFLIACSNVANLILARSVRRESELAVRAALGAGTGALRRTLLAESLILCVSGAVLGVNIPVSSYGRTPAQVLELYREVQQRLSAVPGVDRVALGSTVPWRDAGNFGPGFQFSVEGLKHVPGEDDPRAKFRSVSPGFFAALGVPLVSGRDFTDADRSGTERVVIVSATLAQRLFPGQDPINRHLLWTDSVMRFIGVS